MATAAARAARLHGWRARCLCSAKRGGIIVRIQREETGIGVKAEAEASMLTAAAKLVVGSTKDHAPNAELAQCARAHDTRFHSHVKRTLGNCFGAMLGQYFINSFKLCVPCRIARGHCIVVSKANRAERRMAECAADWHLLLVQRYFRLAQRLLHAFLIVVGRCLAQHLVC